MPIPGITGAHLAIEEGRDACFKKGRQFLMELQEIFEQWAAKIPIYAVSDEFEGQN